MSTSETRNLPVKPPLAARFAPVLLYVLSIPFAFMAGTVTQEPLAAAGIAAGVFSITCGVLIVAPIAGRLAKERFLVALADPDEIDDEMMYRGVAHIVQKMGVLAENEKTRGLFQPLFDGYTRALNASYEGVVNNIRSQAARGAGEFSEAEIGAEFEGMLVDKINAVVSPFLGKAGATDRGKQIVNAKIMQLIHSDNGGHGARAGAPSGGGVDFRRG